MRDLHGVMSKLSQKIIQDLIPREFVTVLMVLRIAFKNIFKYFCFVFDFKRKILSIDQIEGNSRETLKKIHRAIIHIYQLLIKF
jgi:hypothetical protein